ncbi:hypothetical protein NL676_008773 [Syzygium grande]|nr:hypothetical protein NL676_008773 [Syzygium grande]
MARRRGSGGGNGEPAPGGEASPRFARGAKPRPTPGEARCRRSGRARFDAGRGSPPPARASLAGAGRARLVAAPAARASPDAGRGSPRPIQRRRAPGGRARLAAPAGGGDGVAWRASLADAWPPPAGRGS